MTKEHGIVALTEDDIEKAGAVLARAFLSNPLIAHVFTEEEERERLSAIQFSAFIRYGFLAGIASTTDAVDSVAVWLPPDASEMDAEMMAKAGIDKLPTLLGEEAFSRLMTLLGRCGELRQRDADFPHWYLTLIGVEPERQGQGIAGSLLRPLLGRADGDGLPIYLETAAPENVPFYQKYGFEVLVDEVEPSSGVRLLTFLRRPPL